MGIVVVLGILWVLFFVRNGAQYVVNGMRYGSILMLGAIGLTLTYRIMNFANFAHGDLITWGAYITWTFKVMLGLPLFVSALLAVVITPWISIAIDRLVYRRLRKSAAAISIMASFGIALILRSLVQAIWGVRIKNYGLFVRPGQLYEFGVIKFRLSEMELLTMIVALLLVVLLHLFLKYTRMGKAMRATSDNIDLARTTGINTERVITWTWGIGTGLAVVAGVFLGIDSALTHLMGLFLLIQLFAATVLGGIGSPYGAMLGGLIVGLAQNIMVVPVTAIASQYKPAIAFVMMVIMLLIRPQGLLGRPERRG